MMSSWAEDCISLPQLKYKDSHPPELMISSPNSSIQTHSFIRNNLFPCNAFISQKEPKNITEALKESDWLSAM